jgi:hypothetical protein
MHDEKEEGVPQKNREKKIDRLSTFNLAYFTIV